MLVALLFQFLGSERDVQFSASLTRIYINVIRVVLQLADTGNDNRMKSYLSVKPFSIHYTTYTQWHSLIIMNSESGPGARQVKREWVLDICHQCEVAGVPFFFTQWGGVFKKRNGRELDGKTWDQMPRQRIVRATAVR